FVLDTLTCFFLSSRRRHTRSKRDWSSDVCSSDLHSKSIDEAFVLKMLGDYNVENALAAVAAVDVLGIPIEAAKTALKDIHVPGRSEERRVGKECRCRRWGEH